ncbi:unnamed protein product [Trichobilharzia szidati]|nr:unnamed protein product [Trichobilharzia szidati]
MFTFRTFIGLISSVCSSTQCSYPFSSYTELELSLFKSEYVDESEESQTVQGFMDELFGESSRSEVDRVPLSATSTDSLSMQSGICQKSPVNNHFQKNFMLPRYLADDMNRCANEGLCSSKRSTKFNRSNDSGISFSSRSSEPSTPLTYREHVEQLTSTTSNRSETASTTKSVSKFPSASASSSTSLKGVNHLDRMIKLQEELMQHR